MTWILQRQSLLPDLIFTGRDEGTRAPEKEINSLKYTAHTWKSIVLLQVGAASSRSFYSVPSPYIRKDLGFSLLPTKQHPAERSLDFFLTNVKVWWSSLG